jgi:hypothetical protein
MVIRKHGQDELSGPLWRYLCPVNEIILCYFDQRAVFSREFKLGSRKTPCQRRIQKLVVVPAGSTS